MKIPIPSDPEVVSGAQAQYSDQGDVQIDDSAIVSRGSEAGAYVMAWVWVDFDLSDAEQEAWDALPEKERERLNNAAGDPRRSESFSKFQAKAAERQRAAKGG